MRRLLALAAIAVALFAAGCTAGMAHPAASSAPLPPDAHTASALLKVATVFDHDYDSGDYAPVYARWDARSQAIITRADYIARHKDCPSGSPTLSQTESVSLGGPHGAGLVYYEISRRPAADRLLVLRPPPVGVRPRAEQPRRGQALPDIPRQYVAALGCAH
jgi:hypothetical protein